MTNWTPKKIVYVGAFTILGLLLQQLIHAGVEIFVIRLLVSDFTRYSLGLSWASWILIHNIVASILVLGGTILGWQQGNHWWQVIYVERRRFRKNKLL